MSEYIKQANAFAKKHGVKKTILKKEYGKHWEDDYTGRWRFHIKLIRKVPGISKHTKEKSYSFWFGQSTGAGDKEPTFYDIFTCLEKYEPKDFEWWCKSYGYDDKPLSEYPKVLKIYKSVCKEFKGVEKLFPEFEVIEELRDIQ
jgi:hypothetical protein